MLILSEADLVHEKILQNLIESCQMQVGVSACSVKIAYNLMTKLLKIGANKVKVS